MAALDLLTAVYRNLQRLEPTRPIPTDHAAQLTQMAQGIEAMKNGQFGFMWSYESAVSWIQDSVRATTSVAALSYGFMTGGSPSTAGLDYLVSPTGANPNNLNSAYYAKFSMENRYINFAVAIAKEPAANMNFVSDFAPLSLFDAFKKAYGQIFGQTKTDAELNAILTPDRAAYFAAFGGDGPNGLGTKAAMAGWLLAEAVKADLGPYAQANRSFLRDFADGGVHQSAKFMADWGPGGDYAAGGRSDPGLPGETFVVQKDWNVSVNKPGELSDIRPLATDGNDIASGPNGLDGGKVLATGAGNDSINVQGAMRGQIDAGSGNDFIVVGVLDGEVRPGAGYDRIFVSNFGPLDLGGADIVPTAVITGFEKGVDHLDFDVPLGQGKPVNINTLVAVTTLREMVGLVASSVAVGENGVFVWNGSTYVFHQAGTASVEAGDGLVKLVGVTGLSVGNGGTVADIHFGGYPVDVPPGLEM
jgi:hypothetical protein